MHPVWIWPVYKRAGFSDRLTGYRISIWQAFMASRARRWLSGVTPAQQEESTAMSASGKAARSSMALEMTQISVHSPTRVMLLTGSFDAREESR